MIIYIIVNLAGSLFLTMQLISDTMKLRQCLKKDVNREI